MLRARPSPAPPARALALAGAAVLLLAFAGCQDGTGADEHAPVRVALPSDSVVVSRDSTVTVTAQVLDAGGREVQGAAVAWRSSDTTVAAVDAQGRLRGVRLGSAYVVASYARRGGETLSDSARVVVRPGLTFVDVESSISPFAWADVSAGSRVEFPVRVYADGQPLAGAPVTFVVTRGTATLAPASGTTGADGRLQLGITFGSAPDTVVVEARTPWATQPGRFQAVVYPPVRSQLEPDSLVLTPGLGCVRGLQLRIRQPNGTDVIGVSADFRVEDSTVVSLQVPTISGSYRGVSRTVTGQKVGTTRIIASYTPSRPLGQGSPVVDTAVVRVQAPVASGLHFSRGRADSVGVGGEQFASARFSDQCGQSMAGAVSLRTTDPSTIQFLTVESNVVRYRALRTGTARIIAEAGGFADTLTVKVKNVRIQPENPTVSVGASIDLRILAEDASGNLSTPSDAILSARDEADGAGYTLTRDGKFTAKQPGAYYITGYGASVFVGTLVTVVP